MYLAVVHGLLLFVVLLVVWVGGVNLNKRTSQSVSHRRRRMVGSCDCGATGASISFFTQPQIGMGLTRSSARQLGWLASGDDDNVWYCCQLALAFRNG